jgi:ABC-2 type transport system permease protein
LGEHSRLKLVSIVVLGGGIWIGLYVFPYMGFNWVVELLREGTISDVLVSLFFFLLTVMLVFSNGVISYTALFRSPETWFLRSTPLPTEALFLYKLGESLTFSSWAFLLLGVPIMLAYGVHKTAPWYYYPAMVLFFGCFVLIPASVGSLIAMVISTFARPWMRRLLVWAAVAVALVALVLGPSYLRAKGGQGDVFAAGRLLRRAGFSHSVYWPSAWVSRGLAICAGSPGAGDLGDAVYYLGLLLSTSLFSCLLAVRFAEHFYEGAWNRAHSMRARPRVGPSALDVRGRRAPMVHLMVKDLKTFVRDPVQWTQCAVLFGLLGLYILNLRNLRYPSEQPMWRNLTTFLNLGSICLVLATLTTRFVFPMFSLEGRRFWVLGLVPVKRTYVLWSKFVFSFTASVLVTELLMVASDLMLDEPPGLMVLHVVTVALISLGLSGMAVGLSALYPNLRESSPAKIVSGFGGTLNLILSLLFVSVIVAAEALPVHLWATGQIPRSSMYLGLAGAVALVVVLSGVAFGVPMWLGSRALARMEF